MDAANLPPYARLLRIEPKLVDDRLQLVMPFTDDVVGRPGFLHGGAITGLLESAAFGTLRLALADEQIEMKPITVTVDFMRGGRPKPTYADAVIERLGRRMANVDAFAWQDSRDTPIASARMNFLLDRQSD
ncbi:PaaI family thioesterase [Sphingomicrobium sediminis]|uniref:PaaI family thioesterase n=1 Tax=Sphingomicrobium sediminis TaxID=2950949 RepID=A0A9X2J4Q1_9SPHN|nr:PaaI family thioesterase [Sphingomicrobium sediminis]MCM8557457.1 PaaI family thioesterase [Sphingomicrobium sediminis]